MSRRLQSKAKKAVHTPASQAHVPDVEERLDRVTRHVSLIWAALDTLQRGDAGGRDLSLANAAYCASADALEELFWISSAHDALTVPAPDSDQASALEKAGGVR